MKKQMLSWVWHGVWSALTAMLPMLKVSPCFGVLVTFLQSLPPMISRGWPSSESCGGQTQFVGFGGEQLTSSSFPPAWSQWLKLSEFRDFWVVRDFKHSLMSVDDSRELN
jgi:hypothetical protein